MKIIKYTSTYTIGNSYLHRADTKFNMQKIFTQYGDEILRDFRYNYNAIYSKAFKCKVKHD